MKALFRAIDNEHTDATISERCCFKKGDFVAVEDDAHQWGSKEGPPGFVSISCPEVTVDQALAYLERWDLRLIFQVESIAAGWRITASSELPGVLNEAGIPVDAARTYLESNGFTVVSTDVNQVVLECGLIDLKVFYEEIRAKLERPHRRKRWCVSETVIDWALAQGGIDVSVTKTQLLDYLTDKAS